MTGTRSHVWDYAYALFLLIAIPVGIFHAVQGRWPQALLVTIAAIIGAIILITGWNRAEAAVTSSTPLSRDVDTSRPNHPTHIDMDRRREPSGRLVGWLPMGAVSGFVATGIMTGAVFLGYGTSAVLGSDAAGANQLRAWMAALVDNTVTEFATVNLALAIGVHLVAGILWAIVYAGFVEPRVSGTGFQRGVKFGLIPWALSIIVFFPLIGAGFLGADIGAGPSPVLGNLILHLVYGAALGKTYASHAVWQEPVTDVSRENLDVLEMSQRSMAIALLPGAILGLLIGVLGATALGSDADLLMVAVLGALVGSTVGVWIGSLVGLSTERIEHGDGAGA